MIIRRQKQRIISRLFKGKAIVILGARQTGKTTLMKDIKASLDKESLWLDCDEPDVRSRLTYATSTSLKELIGRNRIVFIDEAQRVEDIGITLKLITDNLTGIQLVVSGSSALELTGKINETLTGRKYEFHLYPLSSAELSDNSSVLEESRLLENRMIYGLYPDVINHPGEEQAILKELLNSYLYKDILMYREIRKPHILPKLLQAIALQLGNQVSYNELAKILETDRETVERYLDLLEKMFVIFRLGSFSRNLRTELNKSKKIYFYDNGIRNALISNFIPLSLRQDAGALWENYLIVERLKYLSEIDEISNRHFWRTHQQQEIDYIEEQGGTLNTFEFKWGKERKASLPKTFSNAYPNSSFTLVNRDNYWDLINPKQKTNI
jgi:uncharacterized protein